MTFFSIICKVLNYFFVEEELQPPQEPTEFRPRNYYGEYGNVRKIHILMEVDNIRIYTTEVATQSGFSPNLAHPWIYSRDIQNLNGIPVYIIKDDKGIEHKIVKCEDSKILNIGLIVLRQRLLTASYLGFDAPHANAYTVSRNIVKFSCVSKYDEKIIDEKIILLENAYKCVLEKSKIKAHVVTTNVINSQIPKKIKNPIISQVPAGVEKQAIYMKPKIST